MRISGACNHFTANVSEFLHPFGKCDNLRRANKSEVEWVEEENQVFALVVLKRDLLEFSIDHGSSSEGWGRFSNGRNDVVHGGSLKHQSGSFLKSLVNFKTVRWEVLWL